MSELSRLRAGGMPLDLGEVEVEVDGQRFYLLFNKGDLRNVKGNGTLIGVSAIKKDDPQ